MNFSYTPARKVYTHGGDEFVAEYLTPVCVGASVTLTVLNVLIYLIQHG